MKFKKKCSKYDLMLNLWFITIILVDYKYTGFIFADIAANCLKPTVKIQVS